MSTKKAVVFASVYFNSKIKVGSHHYAEALKKEYEEFVAPEWVFLVKTGSNKQRPTVEPDFWQKRAASILRQVYIKKIVGVRKMRTRYGGRKNRGMRPEVFKKASGKAIRLMLQAGEKVGFLEKVKEGKRFGRKLTKRGKEFLEGIK
jgi:small subunit ribosomal protein S19e